jgi:formamidopyrimidine-DNA glycosylase
MSDRERQLDSIYQRRIEALELANRRRKVNAAMKKAIKARVMDDLELLRGDGAPEHEQIVESWPVDRLLLACNRIGPSRAQEILSVARIAPKRKVNTLSFAQRHHLASLVEEARTIVLA